MSKNIAQIKRQLNEQMGFMIATLLPEYEKQCITEYVSGDETKLIVNNPANQKLSEFKDQIMNQNKVNTFELIYDLTKFELRDTEAFLEAL
jgi:uncharacterized membrane protein